MTQLLNQLLSASLLVICVSPACRTSRPADEATHTQQYSATRPVAEDLGSQSQSGVSSQAHPLLHGVNNCAIDLKPRNPLSIEYELIHPQNSNYHVVELTLNVPSGAMIDVWPWDIRKNAQFGQRITIGHGSRKIRFLAAHSGRSVTATVEGQPFPASPNSYPSRGRFGMNAPFVPPSVKYLQRTEHAKITVNVLGAAAEFVLRPHTP